MILEDAHSLSSIDPSLTSFLSTSSEDSNTVYIYDFHKQETRAAARSEHLQKSETQYTEIELEVPNIGKGHTLPRLPAGINPVRGSTPTAFKFLQPKRRLIDPNQVLELSLELQPPSESVSSSCDKSVIEEEIAQALPSVKALAQAFLLNTNTMPQVHRRWTSKIKSAPTTPSASYSPPAAKRVLQAKPSEAEIAAESNIRVNTPLNLNATEFDVKENVIPRSGVLKNNIAFFENLKFK